MIMLNFLIFLLFYNIFFNKLLSWFDKEERKLHRDSWSWVFSFWAHTCGLGPLTQFLVWDKTWIWLLQCVAMRACVPRGYSIADFQIWPFCFSECCAWCNNGRERVKCVNRWKPDIAKRSGVRMVIYTSTFFSAL